jgi:hypothetical protein
MEPPILEFQGEYRFLSNFWPCRLRTADGTVWPHVEAAYQAAKLPPTPQYDSVRDQFTDPTLTDRRQQLARHLLGSLTRWCSLWIELARQTSDGKERRIATATQPPGVHARIERNAHSKQCHVLRTSNKTVDRVVSRKPV